MKRIKPIADFKVNVPKLLSEYAIVEDKMMDVLSHGNKVLVQKKFHLCRNRIYDDVSTKMSYTLGLCDRIKELFNFADATYRIVMPNTAYNWHFDKGSICYHIPMISNSGCHFIYENESYPMIVGNLYEVHNGTPHTFVNAGSIPRLHLTFENL